MVRNMIFDGLVDKRKNSVQLAQGKVYYSIWTASKNKQFSVKSCYSMLIRETVHWDNNDLGNDLED